MPQYRRFELRPLTADDYEQLGTLVLRQSDQAELIAAYGLSPTEALQKSVAASKQAWAIVFAGKLEGVVGVNEYRRNWYEKPAGIPWLLATDKFPEFRISLAKEVKRRLKSLTERYAYLFNYVDSRNTTSIAWLKWLGFTVDENKPYFFHDPAVPFYLFYLKQAPAADRF